MKKKLVLLGFVLMGLGLVLAQGPGNTVNPDVAVSSAVNGSVDSSNVQGTQNKNGSDENGSGNMGLGQMIRNQVKAGVYTNEKGEKVRVRELAQNRIQLMNNNVSANCDCNLTREKVGNKTQFKMQLGNGKNAEIKVMPDKASEKALERLRLRNCNKSNNCSIELKEVGKGNKTRAAYEVRAEKQARLFGLFKTKMQVQSRIDAENGEVIKAKKPWWAFLASE